MKVQFHFLTPIGLPNRKKLKIFLETLSKKENTRLSQVSYIFCSDEYLLQINKQFLNHDFYTDIISFEISNDPAGKIAEIYISTDRIRDNAPRFKTTLLKELHRVIFHGILHICGYKDKTAPEQQIMTRKEDYYLDLYF
ncbi:MAG: rRNA maturation RNase YbeY [Niastella sp.]|nr:rRNA maturation RNase YbeY [Niastella sp.]